MKTDKVKKKKAGYLCKINQVQMLKAGSIVNKLKFVYICFRGPINYYATMHNGTTA